MKYLKGHKHKNRKESESVASEQSAAEMFRYAERRFFFSDRLKQNIFRLSLNPDLRVSLVAELPRPGEGGQRSEVEVLMLADQPTVHLRRRTDGVGLPPKRGRTTCRLREQHR